MLCRYLPFFSLLLLVSCGTGNGSQTTVHQLQPSAQATIPNQQSDTLTQQYGELEGCISDDQNNPLVGATVLVEATNRGALTNNNGAFRVKKIPPGTHTVRVKSLGFKDAVQEIKLTANTTISVALVLEERRNQLGCPIYKPLADPEQIGTIRTISSAQLRNSPP